jgi:hypothetical protein
LCVARCAFRAENAGEELMQGFEHRHPVFRAYFKSALLKQYKKFSTFLRNELCSNNLSDFGLSASERSPLEMPFK